MSQSCETLIIKINKWQKAILELEKLSDEFLNSGDESLKAEIENNKREITSYEKEYQVLAYPELPNGQNLFWPEKDLLEEILKNLNMTLENLIFPVFSLIQFADGIKIKDFHLKSLSLCRVDLSRPFRLKLSLFQELEQFSAFDCRLKEFPNFPFSIKYILVPLNRSIQINDDIITLYNLEKLNVVDCSLKKLPRLPKSIKMIEIGENDFLLEEEQRIKKEYPNAKIEF